MLKNIEDKTETLPEGLKPERKRIEQDMLYSRVIVICPYEQFNVFFEREIPKQIQGGEASIINWAESDNPPYVNVEKRETGQQKPIFIIDFQKIIAHIQAPHLNKEKLSGLRKQRLKDILSQVTIAEEKYLEDKGYMAFLDLVQRELPEHLRKIWEETKADAKEFIKLVDLVDFKGYKEWAREKRINCYHPTPEYAEQILRRIKYHEGGNFLSGSVSTMGFENKIKHDLTRMATDNDNLNFFTKYERPKNATSTVDFKKPLTKT